MGRPPAMPPPLEPPPPSRPPTRGRLLTRPPIPPPPPPPPPPEESWPGRKLTKGRLLNVSPRPDIDVELGVAASACAARAGSMPAAPSAKLKAPTTARRCVILDKVFPFSTTGHHAGCSAVGANAPNAEIRIPVPQSSDSTGVSRFLTGGGEA